MMRTIMHNRCRSVRRLRASGTLLLTICLLAPFGSALRSEGAVAKRAKAKKGEIVSVSFSGLRLARLKGTARGDEFGSDTGSDVLPGANRGGVVVGAPGWSSSTGRLAIYEFAPGPQVAGRRLYTVKGDNLPGGAVQRFGEAILELGHVSTADISRWAAGAPGLGRAGGPDSAVVILGGANSSLIERLRLSSAPESRLGWTLAPLEAGGGGFASFAAGAPGQAAGQKQNAGAVHRIDSLSGEVLWTLLGSSRSQYLGYSITRMPDIDDDDFPDLLIGAPGQSDRKPAGEAWLVSGIDGRVVRRFTAPADAGLFGFAVDQGDINGDGSPDIVVSAPRSPTAAGEDAGAVFVFGLDGELLLHWEGDTAGQWLGIDVASVRGPASSQTYIAASSLYVNDAKPKRNRRGGLEVLSVDSMSVVGRRLGKRANDRFGWRILSCGDDSCSVGVPKSFDFFMPE